MPVAEFFPYKGPNRRSNLPVVEVILKFSASDPLHFPARITDIRDLLVYGAVIAPDENFPDEPIPDGLRVENYPAWYTSLLMQTALTFQRKTGHRVSFFQVDADHAPGQSLGLMEHEHCDVGMTAMKLALEVLGGRRKFLQGPFKAFKAFARDRLLPIETEAIIKAANERNIPCVQLDRNPFKRADFDDLTKCRCVLPNGLLMLGQGAKSQILDGTYCLGRTEDFADHCKAEGKQQVLTRLSDPDAGHRKAAANELLDWLFPEPQKLSIPTIAVTGTNGKTTTCRMIRHVLANSGLKPGLVCTDGVYLGDELLAEGDKSTRSGHFKVLGNRAVDIAVLEVHHLGILRDGFSFKTCDIAICLNVTEDHLGVHGIETVEQMSHVKRSLLERAADAAILFADDPLCLSMVDSVSADRLCLVSMQDGTRLINRQFKHQDVCFSVLEFAEGDEWLVIYDGGVRLPVMRAREIPATFNATAAFNISNALHAIAACYLAGVEQASIRAAMGTFRTSYETTPGRLNVYDDLPFRVIVDFAHNPDGMRKLAEFVERQNVVGRKVLAFSATEDRIEESIIKMGRSMAGYFDFYFCKEYVHRSKSQPRIVAHFLQQGLTEAGVAEDKIVTTSNGRDVMFEIFDLCKKDDLLVLLLGHVEKHQIADYIWEYREHCDTLNPV